MKNLRSIKQEKKDYFRVNLWPSIYKNSFFSFHKIKTIVAFRTNGTL